MRYLTIPSIPLRSRSRRSQASHRLAALCLAQFLTALAILASMPLLPLYMGELGAAVPTDTLKWTGLALAVTPLLAAIATPVWGVLADRFGHKVAVERALAGVGIAIGLMGLIRSPFQLVVLRAVAGAVGGFSATAQAAALAGTSREEARVVVARLQSAQMSGAVIGPAIGGILAGWLGIRPTLVASGLLLGLGLVAVHLLVPADARRGSEEAAPAGDGETGKPRGQARSLAIGSRTRQAVPLALLLAAMFVVQLGEQALMPILPTYLTGLGAPAGRLPLVVGLTISLASLGMAIAATALPRLIPRTGAQRLVPLLLVAAGLCATALAVLPVWWAAMPVRGLAGLVVGATVGLAYTLGAERAEPRQIGRTMGLLASAAFLGSAAGPLLGSTLAARHVGLLFLTLAALYGATAAVFVLGTRLMAGVRGQGTGVRSTCDPARVGSGQ